MTRPRYITVRFRGPMVASKLLAVVSCAIYLSVELWGLAGRKVTLILFEIVLGMSVGKFSAGLCFMCLFKANGDFSFRRRFKCLPSAFVGCQYREGSCEGRCDQHAVVFFGHAIQSKLVLLRRCINHV